MNPALVIILLSFISCSGSGQKKNKPGGGIEEVRHLVFDQLVGTWLNDDGKTYERWTRQGPGIYHSVVYSLRGSDTSRNENARIFAENGQWVFENMVAGQNEGKAVRFRSSMLLESSVTFSNPDHDFPTDINYTVINHTRLSAYIKGPGDSGKTVTVPYQYTRIN